MSDKRKDSRLSVKLDVEVMTEQEQCSMKTRDLSNSGVYLERGDTQLPAEGDIVQLQIKQPIGGGEPPIVKARVVRVDNDGIALSFISDE